MRFVVLVALAACGAPKQPSKSATAPGDPPATTSPALTITLSDQGIATVSGKAISSQPTVSQLIAIVGKQDRFQHAGNDLFIYDRLGIVLYRKPGTDQCDAVALFYGPTKFDFTPRQLFAGSLAIAGVAIPIGMSQTDVEAKLPKRPTGYMYGYGETKPSFDYDEYGKLSMVWLQFKQPGDED